MTPPPKKKKTMGQELKSFDVDNAYGLEALTRMLTDIEEGGPPMDNVNVTDGWYKNAAELLESVGVGKFYDGYDVRTQRSIQKWDSEIANPKKRMTVGR